MRRLVLVLAVLSLSTAIGCKVAGKCDCDWDDGLCCPPWAHPEVEYPITPVSFATTPPPETIQQLPKKVEKKF